MIDFVCRHNNPFCKRAFTLFELLIVTSLLAATGLAVYHTIAIGIKVWQRSQQYSSQEDVAVIFEKLTEDLQNAVVYSQIPFMGKPKEMIIPTIVRTPVDEKISKSGDFVEQIGAVKYSFRLENNEVVRAQANFSQALKEKFPVSRSLGSRIKGLRFQYFVLEEGTIVRKESLSGQIPASVGISIEFI